MYIGIKINQNVKGQMDSYESNCFQILNQAVMTKHIQNIFSSESNIGKLFSTGYFTTRDICSEMIRKKTSQTNSTMVSCIIGEKC